MKLNHDIYEEAMANIELSEETGMRLLHEASHRKMQRGQRWNLRGVAAAAAMIAIIICFNGICYAQTGQNALSMFLSYFQQEPTEGLSALAKETRESGESFTYDNLKFTLERYWYDQEGNQAFFTIRIESLNGTPLDEETFRETYVILPDAPYGSISCADSQLSADKTSLWEYCMANDYNEQGEPLDKMQIAIRKYPQVIGSFTLEPTGKAKTRYADFGLLGAKGRWARINGAQLTFSLPEPYNEEHKPFDVLDVVMKDGSVYRFNNNIKLPYTAESLKQLKKENIRLCTYSIFSDCGDCRQDGKWANYCINFGDYIDVDEIAAIYADGSELILK